MQLFTLRVHGDSAAEVWERKYRGVTAKIQLYNQCCL